MESECRITELAQAHNPDVNVTCSAVKSSYYRQALYCKYKNGTTIASLGSNSDEELLKWVVSPECNGRNGAICLNLLDVQDKDSHCISEHLNNYFLFSDGVRSSENLYPLWADAVHPTDQNFTVPCS